MKQLWIMLLAVSLALVIALPAGAAKPDCNIDPSHSSCKVDEPRVGLTCAEAETAGWDHVDPEWGTWDLDGDGEFEAGFRVVLNRHEGACVDVESAAGDWWMDVQVGSAREVYLSVQDSVAPGDWCWGYGHGNPEALVTEDVTLSIGLPASTADICGDNFADGDDQLAFNAAYAGRRKLATPVTITVTLP